MAANNIEKERRLRTGRRRMNIFFGILLAASAAAAAHPASKLVAAYKEWRAAVRTDSASIPLEGLPAMVTVTVSYDAEPPLDAQLVDPVSGVPLAASVSDDGSRLSLSADLPQDFGDSVTLSLRPLSNRTLDYGITIAPSRRHIGLDAELVADGSGGLWLSGRASAPFALERGQPVHMSVSLYGKMREPVLWEGELDRDGSFLLDLSVPLDSRNLSVLSGEKVLVSCTAMDLGEGPQMSARMELDPGRARDAVPGELPEKGTGTGTAAEGDGGDGAGSGDGDGDGIVPDVRPEDGGQEG